jgi:DNA-binding NtrC family response regulator
VVDDDPSILQSIRAFLSPHGCKITGSQSAHAALQFLQENTPSALLVDLRMQGEDSGLAVIDELNTKNSNIPTALITGESLADGRLANAYPELVMLQKPVSNDALLGLLDYMVMSKQEDEESDTLVKERSDEEHITI